MFGSSSPSTGLFSPQPSVAVLVLQLPCHDSSTFQGEPREQRRAGETAGENWRLLHVWNEGYKCENRSTWERESVMCYKSLFQRSPEHETSSSVIQVRFQGSSIVGVLTSAVVCSSKFFYLTSPEFILVNECMFIFEECPCLDKKIFFIIMKRLSNSSTFFFSPDSLLQLWVSLDEWEKLWWLLELAPPPRPY